VSLAVARYARIVGRRPGENEASRQQRVYSFMNDRSFADYIGDLPEDVEALFKPTVTRSSADLDEISAGAGVGYFSLVWNIGAGLSQSIVGGPSTLTESIAAALAGRVQLNSTVNEIVHKKNSVVVRYRQDGSEKEIEARCVVLATPATVSHRIAVDLDHDVRDALSKIAYGPYVATAFLTNETERQVWDDAYAVATPKRSFNVPREPGAQAARARRRSDPRHVSPRPRPNPAALLGDGHGGAGATLAHRGAVLLPGPWQAAAHTDSSRRSRFPRRRLPRHLVIAAVLRICVINHPAAHSVSPIPDRMSAAQSYLVSTQLELIAVGPAQ
jgi:Flavin containing amine oxidoreductase